jgi:hypothetical protein
MDRVESFEELLDYVFTDEDIKESPNMKEYKQLNRVMNVMVKFYIRGEETKKNQFLEASEQMKKIDGILCQVNLQIKSLAPFPEFHPKRKGYLEHLEKEKKELTEIRDTYATQAKGFEDLYHWGGKIVQTMRWLEGNLKHYANQNLETNFDLEPIKLTPDEYLLYKGGLEEVTYNLQESQDFFDASLDGRLNKYHDIEKNIIEAQLAVLSKWPEDDQRRQHVEAELKADLEFVVGNMEESPKIRRHRERMQAMHKDFFALLKWQRNKIQTIMATEPEIFIDGDVEKLKADLELLRIKAEEKKAFRSKFGDSEASVEVPEGGLVIKNLYTEKK